jgi:hypothetical protein
MREAEIVLVLLPRADGQIKNRPALFLREMPPFNDALLCGISTQLSREVKGFDEVITQSDEDFVSIGGAVKRKRVKPCRLMRFGKKLNVVKKRTLPISKDTGLISS